MAWKLKYRELNTTEEEPTKQLKTDGKGKKESFFGIYV